MPTADKLYVLGAVSIVNPFIISDKLKNCLFSIMFHNLAFLIDYVRNWECLEIATSSQKLRVHRNFPLKISTLFLCRCIIKSQWQYKKKKKGYVVWQGVYFHSQHQLFIYCFVLTPLLPVVFLDILSFLYWRFPFLSSMLG